METASTQKEMAAMVGLSREQDRPGRTRGKEAAAPRGGGLASAALGPARGARPALPPAPPYILMVPLDPRLVLSTSRRRRAALTLTASAACARATSVLGFTVFAAATAAAEEKKKAMRRAESSEPAHRGREALCGSSGKVGAPGPPLACPRAAAIGPRPVRHTLIGSRLHGACGPTPRAAALTSTLSRKGATCSQQSVLLGSGVEAQWGTALRTQEFRVQAGLVLRAGQGVWWVSSRPYSRVLLLSLLLLLLSWLSLELSGPCA
nr:uncharacterized protein LOC103246564 [Chlorocebus sabaeus]XP_037846512.1 uncharacterized protein LOC103246564 [Chlorocebus sabaeus]